MCLYVAKHKTSNDYSRVVHKPGYAKEWSSKNNTKPYLGTLQHGKTRLQATKGTL